MAIVKIMIWNKITNQVVNDNYVMDSDNLPIQGLDPNYEAYIYHTPNQPAPIDVRKFVSIEHRERTTTPHPLFAGYNQYLITYTEELRPNAELIIEVKNREKEANAMLKQWQITYSEPTPKAVDIQKKVVDLKENEANETIIPYEKRLKLTTLAVWVLMKHLNLQTNDQINATSLSAKDKKRLRLFRRAALKIHNNDVERDNKHALIDASSLPDLTTNWDLNNFTEEV